MRLLLDTHAFLWFAWGEPQPSRPARDWIEDEASPLCLSATGVWEMAFKAAAGRDEVDDDDAAERTPGIAGGPRVDRTEPREPDRSVSRSMDRGALP